MKIKNEKKFKKKTKCKSECLNCYIKCIINANECGDQNKLWPVNLTITFIGFDAKLRVSSNYQRLDIVAGLSIQL
jgi:hypothetical protein